MLIHLAKWFEPVHPQQNYRQAHYAVFWLIIAAGAFLRFWSLGEASLHGDEDIMGLAARGVVEHGIPLLPSGMFYPRALLHTYIIAGSTMLFGDTEWAIRVPSALVGILAIVFAFFLGKRFLRPWPNLAFVALIAFLPAMIHISQSGRMYIFLVASLLAFGALLFAWEKTGRWHWLMLSMLAWMLALHFHALALFGAILFFFPGLSNQSYRQLAVGTAAITASYLIYRWSSALISSFYPDSDSRLEIPREDLRQEPLQALIQDPVGATLTVLAVLLALGVLVYGLRKSPASPQRGIAILLMATGILACAIVEYAIGIIALLLGSVVWLRAGGSQRAVIALVPILGSLLVVHLAVIIGTGDYTLRQTFGTLFGIISPNPWLGMIEFTPPGVFLYFLAFGAAMLTLSKGRTIPIHFLFFVVAVGIPLIAIGFFTWSLPARYMLGLLPFFLVSLVAALDWSADMAHARWDWWPKGAPMMILALATIIIMVNPLEAWRVAQNDHSRWPDHRGAAEFIREATALHPDAILIAEDSINQTYYLGHVNYRLLNIESAAKHSKLVDGILRDEICGSVVIGSGEALLAILDAADALPVFIIGTGKPGGSTGPNSRGNGIEEVLESDQLEIVFESAEDGRTRVWVPRTTQPLL